MQPFTPFLIPLESGCAESTAYNKERKKLVDAGDIVRTHLDSSTVTNTACSCHTNYYSVSRLTVMA